MSGDATRLIGNSTWNAIAFVIGVGLNLLILPFVISHLGISEFGLAGLVLACLAPALIFSNTLSLMTARELAQHLPAELKQEAKRIFSTSLFLAITFGCTCVILLLTAGPWLAGKLFNLDVENRHFLVLCFVFGSTGWLCQCLSGVFQSLFIARQDYARLAIINIGITVGATTLMWIFIPHRPQASTYLACQASGFAIGFVTAIWLSYNTLPAWVSLPALYLQPLRRLARVGGWQLVAQSGGVVSGQIDRYFLGVFLQTRYVGYYNVAQRLEEAVYIGVLKVGEVLFPFFSVLEKTSEEVQANVFFRASWLLTLIAVSALGGLIPVASLLLQIWTNAEIAKQAEHVLVILAIAGMLGVGKIVFTFYLLGNGRTRTSALISISTAIIILITSAVALPLFGWIAVGWGTCAGMIVQMIITTSLINSSFKVPDTPQRIIFFILAPSIVGPLMALLLREVLTDILGKSIVNWLQIFGLYGLSAMLIASTVILVACVGPYRLQCLRDLQSIAAHLTSFRNS